MCETDRNPESLYPHELLYKRRWGMIISMFVIGFGLSVTLAVAVNIFLNMEGGC
jgi:hypothetical protein